MRKVRHNGLHPHTVQLFQKFISGDRRPYPAYRAGNIIFFCAGKPAVVQLLHAAFQKSPRICPSYPSSSAFSINPSCTIRCTGWLTLPIQTAADWFTGTSGEAPGAHGGTGPDESPHPIGSSNTMTSNITAVTRFTHNPTFISNWDGVPKRASDREK